VEGEHLPNPFLISMPSITIFTTPPPSLYLNSEISSNVHFENLVPKNPQFVSYKNAL